MGYRSYYTLTVHSENEADLIKQLREENDEARYAFDDEGVPQDELTWYDSDDDMKSFSLKHPGVLFEMFRKGEENEDMSYTYYKDGKQHHCPAIITYDDFDETKLK